MKRCGLWRAAILGLAAAAAVAPRTAPAIAVRAVRIDARGAVPVDESFVRAHLETSEGGEFDRAQVAADVRALQETHRFSQVTVEADPVPGGVEVVYAVTAKPRLVRIRIRGAEELSNSKVMNLLDVAVGREVDNADLAAGVRRLQDEYLKRYYPEARVTWTLTPGADPGQADLKVTIKEGPRALVRAIRFSGNTAISNAELTQGLSQRCYHWYNPVQWFTSTGRLNPDDVDADRYAVRRAYLDRGYLDVRVGEPDVRITRSRATVNFPIREGQRYHIRSVSIEGATVFSTNELAQAIFIHPGEVASMDAIDRSADALADYYGNRGYLRTGVVPDVASDPQAGEVDVHFRIHEGKLSMIRDIRIRGNAVTRDKVIRRELVVYPGQRYDRSKVKTSERRLLNLGYFSYVNSVVESTPDPSRNDLVFEVEEQRMGQAAVGVGFSSIDQLSGYFEISHGNFDIRHWPPVGGGEKMRLRTTLGTQRKDVELSFVEPWFLDRKLALGVDLFHHEKSYLSGDYDQRNTGGRLSLGRPLGGFNRLTWAYGFQKIDIYNVDRNASPIILEEAGSRTKSEVTLTLTHDSRDRAFIPTQGNRTQASAGLAGGPFAGDTDLYSLELRSAQYQRLWWGHVLMVRGDASVVQEYGNSDRVPIFDRYFLGGANTIRGFKYRDVGPRDTNGDAVGGRSELFASAEYTVPLFEKVRGAVFYDCGMVWPDAYEFDTSLNSSYGVGVRLDIPMLPLRLDYSWPLETDAYNDRSGGRFSFWIGYGY